MLPPSLHTILHRVEIPRYLQQVRIIAASWYLESHNTLLDAVMNFFGWRNIIGVYEFHDYVDTCRQGQVQD